MSFPYIITETSLTVIADGNPVTIPKSDATFGAMMDAIREEDWDKVRELSDKPKAINKFSKGAFTVENGCILYDGEEVHNHVASRILNFIEEGIDAQPLLNFLEKLLDNPSKRCVDQLFAFMEHGNMPLDPDGDFYAYKAVQSNWTDKHSGKFDNSIGQTVEVKRNKVDDNPAQSCSYGLHAGSLGYVKSFGSGNDKTIIVKINPRDVVSVPTHDDSKLRCCKYIVTGEYVGPLPESTYEPGDHVEPEFTKETCDECDGDGCYECDYKGYFIS